MAGYSKIPLPNFLKRWTSKGLLAGATGDVKGPAAIWGVSVFRQLERSTEAPTKSNYSPLSSAKSLLDKGSLYFQGSSSLRQNISDLLQRR